MVPVPRGVRAEARRALALRTLGFEGAVETGWKRARQLSSQDAIPVEDLRFMRNWYARHVHVSYPSYRDWVAAGSPDAREWRTRRGIIAWLVWGGDAGLNWVNSRRARALLAATFGRDYEPIQLMTR